MASTKSVTCGECSAKTSITAPADEAWEPVDFERTPITRPDGSSAVENVATRERVTWKCPDCGASNEVVRDRKEPS